MRRDQQAVTITRLRGLQVQLLGRPRLEMDGQPMARLMPAKQQALVFYLAGQDRAVPRSRLAALLWSRLEVAAARANLRVALSRLRKLLPQAWDIDDTEVALAPAAATRVDWRELDAIARAPDRHPLEQADAAARSWRGQFLDGFELGDADEFDEWVNVMRPRAARAAIALRRHLARACEAAGGREAAIAHLRAWLDIDDADEEAHIALIRLQASCGRRTAAIAQYEACRAALLERLGARPSADCYALYRRIHADAPQPQASQPDAADLVGAAPEVAPPEVAPPEAAPSEAPPLDASRPAPLPAAAAGTAWPSGLARPPAEASEARLVGRAAELATLRERLLDEQCRWLTIVGPGGIGKTRLAQAAAGRLEADFGAQAWFSGRELDEHGYRIGRGQLAESIVQSVATAAGSGSDRVLLILDNLESVPDARELAEALLARLPQATLLATSRVRVGGSREWLLELTGLDLARNPAGEAGSSEAARLFCACLRRIDPRFDPGRHADAIERICRHAGGLPLAIELAAHGAGTVGIDAMAGRIEAGMVLTDPERRPDDPHRSLDVVLEDSWALLSEPARAAATVVAALPDEFDLDLAEAVSVDLDAIEMLRKHSWLGRTADGQRLAMHPLQRKFLRRHEGAGECSERVAELLAAALRARLCPVAPFGDLAPELNGPGVDGSGPTQSPALIEPPAIRMASEHVFRDWAPDPLAAFVDALTARLVAQEQHGEAAALLERASRCYAVPAWRRTGWLLRCAEIANEGGDPVGAMRGWRNGLEQMGFGDLEAQALLPIVTRGLRRLAGMRGWPDAEPERTAFSRMLARGLMQFGQHLALTARPLPLFACGALQWLVATRALGAPERACAGAGSAYGHLLLGASRLSHLFLRNCERRGLRAEDERMRLLTAETLLVCKVAQGQWHGLLPLLDDLTLQWRARRCTRHEMECRSLGAKLAYYQGLLPQAARRFADVTLHAHKTGPQPGRFWGPMGEAEAGMALGSIPDEDLRRLLERSRHAMAESENIDSAYTLRWFGLRARLASRTGDIDTLRETTMTGAAAASRIVFCGFWAHEGYGGIGEGLIELRRRERESGGNGSSLTETWRSFRKPLRAHCRRFPPAASLWHYLHALDAAERERPAEARRHLREAVRHAERLGLRLELARACRLIGLLERDQAWTDRAANLYRDMGAAGEARSAPAFLPGAATARLAGV